MLQRMDIESDDMTLGQLREQCLSESAAQSDEIEPGALRGRLSVDDINKLKPYTLIPHRPNYILLANYNSEGFNADPFRLTFNDPTIQLDDTEALFQISIKIPLAIDLFGKRIDIFGAYTNRSFWQVYNSDQSAPFRDTNHEPEAWIQFRPDWNILGLTNSANQLGINHQSNGRGGLLSRSWNRVFANVLLERNNFVLSIKPWIRIEEDEEDDDNPDIEDFLGNFEFTTAYRKNDQEVSVMLRNNLESEDNRGAIQVDYTFPLHRRFRGYVQFFNGYGESLIDYDAHIERIGIGILLSDLL